MMRMMKGCTKTYVALSVVGALTTIFGGVLFPLGDHLIREEVKKKVIIADNSDSESYEIWQNNPVPLYMDFFLFDVTNVQEVLDGGKPVLVEKGPYTYREHRIKFDIKWNSNGTATYRENRTFHFVREKSIGPETDMVNTLNPLIAAIAQSFRYYPSTIKSIVSFTLALSGSRTAFVHRPVRDLIWGYRDPLLASLKTLLPAYFSQATVGYFIRKNYTNDGLYTVETGEDDVDDLGKITRYNGKRHVDVWTTPWANLVNGSDGTSFPPFSFDDDTISAFQSDTCRSVVLYYEKEVHSPQDIKLRRFRMGPSSFANATYNPDNLGFCTPQTHCLPTGLQNNTACEKPVDAVRVPLVVSMPHFLYVDPSIQDSVEGLSPDDKQHDSTVDIEPWTGFPMRINKRMQVNFFVEQVKGISQMQNIRTLFFPILWMDENIVVDDKRADLVKDQLFLPMDILLGLKIGLLVAGGLLLMLGVALVCRRRYKENQTLQSTLDPNIKEVPHTTHVEYYGSNGYTKPF